MLHGKKFTQWPWPLTLKINKSIGFQILLRTKYVPSLVKIHWRMLILECSQGCYVVKIWPGDLDLWHWKSIGFQILLRTKYVPSLVKIHWRMLIPECSQRCDGRTEGSVTISLRNFAGEGIITPYYAATIKMLALSSTKCRICWPFKEIFNFSNCSRLGLDTFLKKEDHPTIIQVWFHLAQWFPSGFKMWKVKTQLKKLTWS
jgi:hypothetical protein